MQSVPRWVTHAELTDSVSMQAAPTGWEVDYRNDQATADTIAAEVICATP